jgi:flagellin-like hook-associated protein FlgL
MKLFEFRNILDVTYGAYVVKGAYRGISKSSADSVRAPGRDRAVAVIRELLAGNTTAVRKNARDASTAVSTMQIFTDAVEKISGKLTEMKELAEKASSPDYSQVQVEEMQKRFRNLAGELNQTAGRAEYKFARPFGADGKTVSIPTGNGSKVDIFARDFSFDTDGLDIVADPEKVLSSVNGAIAKIDDYKTYLNRQAAHLNNATEFIESQIRGAMGVDMQDFQPELAVPMADYAASLIAKDKQSSLDTQANLTPEEILKLLSDSD